MPDNWHTLDEGEITVAIVKMTKLTAAASEEQWQNKSYGSQ